MNARTRELVRERAGGPCEYCRLPDFADEWPFHVDHVDLFNPRQDTWRDHFALADDGRLVGLTPTGRATVRLLDMNGSPQIDLRRELIQQGAYSID